ncbi:hypothetical protein A0J61_00543 [Choanephora cucurbitarum]|uniref:Uncharacterized protein n=1 Tax=Choanephora cucurbitarum TaxID=101091 RepID=A0A1C7NSD5_9FUNG|nr:hypothetical protein A0J61_00543 [Choanephora cucurbitarum]
MEVKSHTSVLYPIFHDNYHSGTKSQKEIDIDTSIYQLLSLYLNKEEESSLVKMKKSSHTKSYHWKKTGRLLKSQKSWLGEERQKSEQELILERNTLQNSSIQNCGDETLRTKKPRSKSVSFDDKVTVIVSQEKIISKSLDMETQEEEFVDALEYLE